MYCRNCGSPVRNGAEFCVNCGCRPLNGDAYCQECGAQTTQRQEVCVKCGYMLQTGGARIVDYWGYNDETYDIYIPNEPINVNFSMLPLFYQREFTRIYQSNEQYKGAFNVAGFLFAAIWAFTKGCWLSAVVAIVLSIFTLGLAGVAYWFIFGFRGTYIYYCSYVKNQQRIF